MGVSGGEMYTVFDEESESEVENLEILHPDLEIKISKFRKKNRKKSRLLDSRVLKFERRE